MSEIAQKSIQTFFARIATQSAGVLTGILLARALGPYGKGLFTYVGTLLSVLQTIGSGQSAAVSWQYGRRKRPSGSVLRATLVVLAWATIVISSVLLGIALFVPGQRVLIAVAIAAPFAFLAQIALGFFLADGKVTTCNIQSFITPFGFLAALSATYFLIHGGIATALALWVLAVACSAVYSVVMLRPYFRNAGENYRSLVREQLFFGGRVSANAVVSLLNFRIDVFIVLFMLGAKALGVYSIAIGAGELMWQLSRPLGVSAFRRINSGTTKDAIYITAKCVRHSLLMVSAACVLLYFVAPFGITLVYGKAFAGAVPAVRVLLPGIVAYSMNPFFNGFFTQHRGRPGLPLAISTLSTLICALMTIATIGYLGIVAGALATSVSYTAAFLVNMFLFIRDTGISLKDLFKFGRDDIRPYIDLIPFVKTTS